MKAGFKLILVTLPIAAIGAGFLAYSVSNKQPPARSELAERAIAVRVISAQAQEVVPRVVGFGVVAPVRSFEAIAQVGGTVEYVNPDLNNGAILPAGAELVRLSPADFNLAIAQAEANIRAAKAKLVEFEVQKTNQSAALAIEKEVLALKASERDRAEVLFKAGTASQSARDAALAGHLAQRQKVQGIESTLALLPTQREVQVEQIAVYKASAETAALNLERVTLRVPFAGRVAAHEAEVGQYVKVGQTVAVLDGIDSAEVAAQVPVSALRKLLQRAGSGEVSMDATQMGNVLQQLGLSAQVRLRLGDEDVVWNGRVDRISDTIDQRTGTVGVIVQVDAAYAGARPGGRPPLTKGMFVEVVLSAPATRGIVVPRSALRDGVLYVVDQESRLQPVMVDPVLVQDDIAVIAQEVAPGTKVVVSTPSPALPGMLLQVTEDMALTAHLAAQGTVQGAEK